MPNSTNGTADIKKHSTAGKFTKGSQQPGRHQLDILLADDGSEHAHAAVDMLCDLPLPPETTIHALVVVPTLDRPRHILLETALSETETQLKKSGVQVHAEVKGGVPAASINDYAERHKPDLVVLGAKGLRATLGILLGGVAQQVVEYSCCPVMVVRAPYLGTRRVLVVTDGSAYSQCALAYLGADVEETADMGTKCEARLPLPEDVDIRIMHILPPLITSDMLARSWTVGPDVLFPSPAEPIDEKALQEEEEHQGQALLDEAVRAMKSGGVESSSVLMRGDAATEIINYVKENDIDLIVCGSRGLSQVSGWLLGSVSRKLVHYAERSVLIVKKGRHDKDRR
jgi:nucleotide-binding universal stress UspA family protein